MRPLTAEILYWAAYAAECHAILFWNVWPNGDYQPLMFPVDEATWSLVVQ